MVTKPVIQIHNDPLSWHLSRLHVPSPNSNALCPSFFSWKYLFFLFLFFLPAPAFLPWVGFLLATPDTEWPGQLIQDRL